MFLFFCFSKKHVFPHIFFHSGFIVREKMSLLCLLFFSSSAALHRSGFFCFWGAASRSLKGRRLQEADEPGLHNQLAQALLSNYPPLESTAR